jgi:trans-2,3-dihydro-3-hydroxyanthranilate isomerase
LPFAGHPNVGTGFVLARAMDNPPEHLVFEEIAGLVRVDILRDQAHRMTGARIAAPRSLSIGDVVPIETVSVCASLRQDDILTSAHHPQFASVGTEFAIAEIANLEALSRATPDLAAFHAVGGLAPMPADGGQPRFALLIYARHASDTTRLRARMFGPLGGILEDPATGSACAALAGLLTSLAPVGNVQLHFEIEQGIEMGRPSLLIASGAKTAEGSVTATVGGGCVPTGRGELEI